jgi:hypothetical protein
MSDLFLNSKTTQYGSHMITTNVHKETKVKYINIDTRFSDEYNTYLSNSSYQPSQPTFIQPKTYVPVSSYTFTLPNRFTEVKSISVTNIEIPNTFFNISTNFGNNAISVTDVSNTTYTTKYIDISDNYYSQTQLVSSLNAGLLSLGSPISLDLSAVILNNSNNSSQSYYTTIQNNNTKDGSIVNFAVDQNGAFNKYNFKFSLGWVLGFRNPTYSIAKSTSIRSEAIADMNGPRYLYLVIDEFSQFNQNSFFSPLPSSLINKNILARISVDSKTYPYGSIITANHGNGLLLTDTRSYSEKINIQKLNIQLISENGTVMNLNGQDFSFCLKIEHY